MSLDEHTFDSKSQQGLGLSRDSLSSNLVASLISLQNQDQRSNSTWGSSLFQLPEERQFPLRLESNISSPTSSTSSTHSFESKGAPSKPATQTFDIALDAQSDSSSSSSSTTSSSKSVNSSRYKTELCRPYQENGTCKYGEKCQFAHGSKELRTISRHPKYKTDLCRTYHSSGFCPYGPRCHFIHNLDEQNPGVRNKVGPSSNSQQNNREDKEPVAQLPIFQSRRNIGDQSPKEFQIGETSLGDYQPSRSEDVANQGSPISRLPVFSTLFH